MQPTWSPPLSCRSSQECRFFLLKMKATLFPSEHLHVFSVSFLRLVNFLDLLDLDSTLTRRVSRVIVRSPPSRKRAELAASRGRQMVAQAGITGSHAAGAGVHAGGSGGGSGGGGSEGKRRQPLFV